MIAVSAAAIARPSSAVVRDAELHQEAAEVGVAEAERAVVVAVLRDALRRVAREIDEDLLRDEEDAARVAVALDVERAVVAQELGEVDARRGCRPCRRGTCTRSTGWTR